MDSTLLQIFQTIIGGGAPAIIAVLIAIISYLAWDKKTNEKNNTEKIHNSEKQLSLIIEILQKSNQDNFDSIKRERSELISIIERYQNAQIDVLEAINEIRILIATISGKI